MLYPDALQLIAQAIQSTGEPAPTLSQVLDSVPANDRAQVSFHLSNARKRGDVKLMVHAQAEGRPVTRVTLAAQEGN